MKLTKTALSKFIKWSTSRYNEMTKRQAVEYAHDLLSGKREPPEGGIATFSCGSYTPSSAMTHYADYWVNVAERYIATGIAHWDYKTRSYTYDERDRLEFDKET